MGFLSEVEDRILEQGSYGPYTRFIEDAAADRRDVYSDQIRYMLAVSQATQDLETFDDVSFSGGLGVLVNLASVLGSRLPERLLEWRGTRDLDLIVKSPAVYSTVLQGFDVVTSNSHSKSIQNQRTFRGSSADSNGSPLSETSVDVYVSSPGRGEEFIHDYSFGRKQWDNSTVAPIFSVPVRAFSAIDLLGLKLQVRNSQNTPRASDCEDVINLAGVLMHQGLSPRQVIRSLPKKSGDYLKQTIGYIKARSPHLLSRAVVKPDYSFLREVTQTL